MIKKTLTIRERVKKMNTSVSGGDSSGEQANSGWSTYTNDSLGKPSMEISPSMNNTGEFDLM